MLKLWELDRYKKDINYIIDRDGDRSSASSLCHPPFEQAELQSIQSRIRFSVFGISLFFSAPKTARTLAKNAREKAFCGKGLLGTVGRRQTIGRYYWGRGLEGAQGGNRTHVWGSTVPQSTTDLPGPLARTLIGAKKFIKIQVPAFPCERSDSSRL